MSAEVEFALKKQQLQYRSAELRAQLADYAHGVTPVLKAGDAIIEGVHWLKRHPEAIAAASLAVIVARPRGAFRWARRGIAAWQTWHRARGWLDHWLEARHHSR